MSEATRPPVAGANRRGLRGAGAVNGAMAVAVLLVIALVAVRVNQTPPPTVAELQPNAHQQITQAPQNQAAETGPGSEAGAAAAGLPSPSPSPLANLLTSPSPSIQPGRVLQCIGGRQTDDPQSPPCVPYWDPKSDNGGATSVGVTRDFVYVAWPDFSGFFENSQATKALLGYFNSHFELYGRKVLLEDCMPTNELSAPDTATMQKDAARDASGTCDPNSPPKPTFAALSYIGRSGEEHYYYDALAQRHVISVNVDPTATDEVHYQRFAPYEWSVVPGLDYDEKALAQMTCNSLKGRPPQYAGQTVSAQPSRVFGIGITSEPDGSVPDLSPLTDALSACGAPVGINENASVPNQFVGDAMKKGVTSIECVCSVTDVSGLMNAASRQGYFPEWIVHEYGFQNVDNVGTTNGGSNAPVYPAEHQNHVFGLTFFNKINPPDQAFWFDAAREGDPTYTYGDNGADATVWHRYEEMLVLFSGLQLAGPHLTPQSFQDGLYRARFPDPGHGAAPYYQALVGFGPGMHSFDNDAAPIWYNPQAQNYTSGEPRDGSFCYIGHGLRFGPGQWPSTLNFFGGQPCR